MPRKTGRSCKPRPINPLPHPPLQALFKRPPSAIITGDDWNARAALLPSLRESFGPKWVRRLAEEGDAAGLEQLALATCDSSWESSGGGASSSGFGSGSGVGGGGSSRGAGSRSTGSRGAGSLGAAAFTQGEHGLISDAVRHLTRLSPAGKAAALRCLASAPGALSPEAVEEALGDSWGQGRERLLLMDACSTVWGWGDPAATAAAAAALVKWVNHLEDNVAGLEELALAICQSGCASAPAQGGSGAAAAAFYARDAVSDAVRRLALLGTPGKAAALRLLAAAPAALDREAVAAAIGGGWGDGAYSLLVGACDAVRGWGDQAAAAAAATALDQCVQKAQWQLKVKSGSHSAAATVRQLLITYAVLGAAPGKKAADRLLAMAPLPSLALAVALRHAIESSEAAGQLAEALIGAAAAANQDQLSTLLLKVGWATSALSPAALGRVLGGMVSRAAQLASPEERARALLSLLRLAQTGEVPVGGGAQGRAWQLPGGPVALPHGAAAQALDALAAAGVPFSELESAFEFVTSAEGGGLWISAVPLPILKALAAAWMQQGRHVQAWALVQAAGGASATKGARLLECVLEAWEALPAAQLPADVLRMAVAAEAPTSQQARRVLELLAAAIGKSPAAAALELALAQGGSVELLLRQIPAAAPTGAEAVRGLEEAAEQAEQLAASGPGLPTAVWQQMLHRLGDWEAAGAATSSIAAAAARARLLLVAHSQLLAAAEGGLSFGGPADAEGSSAQSLVRQRLGRALVAALECPLMVEGPGFAARRASEAAEAAAGAGDAQLKQRLADGWAAIAERVGTARARLATACADAVESSPGNWLQLPDPSGSASAVAAQREAQAAARRLAVSLCAQSGRPRAVVELYVEYRRKGYALELGGGLLEAALAAAAAEPDLAVGTSAAPAAIIRSAQELCQQQGATWVPAAGAAPGAWATFLEARAADAAAAAGGDMRGAAAAGVGAVVELLLETEGLWSAGGQVTVLPAEAVKAALRALASRAADTPVGAASGVARLLGRCSLGGAGGGGQGRAAAPAAAAAPARSGSPGGGGKRKGSASKVAGAAAPADLVRPALPTLTEGVLFAAADALVAAGKPQDAAEQLAPLMRGVMQLPAAHESACGDVSGGAAAKEGQEQRAVAALLRALQAHGRAEAAARAEVPALPLLRACGVGAVTSWVLVEALGGALVRALWERGLPAARLMLAAFDSS